MSVIARRSLIASLPALALAPRAFGQIGPIATLERRLKARIGVHAITASGKRIYSYHANEWAPMCSTFKLPLAGAVLNRVDKKTEQLDRMVPFTRADLLATSPVTTAEAANGKISVEKLVKAVLEVSDNTGANLLLRSVGGPQGFTRWLREIGDPSTRLDRYEPDLNTALLGDQRDTTTPKAMAETVRSLLFGDVLTDSSKKRVEESMVACQTGLNMLRAGLPKDWRVGDKTGRGGNGATNDVAVIWRPDEEPVICAVYLADCPSPLAAREGAIAEIGHLLTGFMARPQGAGDLEADAT